MGSLSDGYESMTNRQDLEVTNNNFKHIYKEKVRWGDCDMLGHVNNVLYLRYSESARIDYVQQITKVYMTPETKKGWILADIQCSFRKQVRYPNNLEITSGFVKIGNSSAVFDNAIYIENEAEPAFTSRAVVVWFDFELQSSNRIPDEIRERIRSQDPNCEGL